MIRSLNLVHYKNHLSGTYVFADGLNFIVGRNGVGKTNLADAVYYLCMARSHSTPQDKDSVQFNKDFFRLEGTLLRSSEEHHVFIKVKPGSLKEISVDGKVMGKLSEYVGYLPVVMLAPEDILLIQGGSAPRRKFLDMIGIQIGGQYLELIQKYQKLLSQRNALLRNDGPAVDRKLLMTYTNAMEVPAAKIVQLRSSIVKSLSPIVGKYYQVISDSREKPQLQYISQLHDANLAALASRSLDLDLNAGYTTKGIHKDDISFSLNDQPAKRFGSQGQVKSLLIALQLAQTDFLRDQTGIAPILILDDIFDRLDDARSDRLTEILVGLQQTQILITDASEDRRERLIERSGLTAKVIHLEGETHGDSQENDNLHDYVNEEE